MVNERALERCSKARPSYELAINFPKHSPGSVTLAWRFIGILVFETDISLPNQIQQLNQQ